MVITISDYPKVHSFFQKGTRSWCKFPVEPSLPLGSLKRPNCQGPCFPTAVPKHWGSCVFPSWTGWRCNKKLQQTNRYQKAKQKQKARVHDKVESSEQGETYLRTPGWVRSQWAPRAPGGTWFAHPPGGRRGLSSLGPTKCQRFRNSQSKNHWITEVVLG